MAAFASAVTITSQGCERISRNLGILTGKIDITNYNTTPTEITDITRYFKTSSETGLEKGIVFAQFTSSENGYVLGFDKSTGKVKAYRATPSGTNSKPAIKITKGAVGSSLETGLSADAAAATLNNNTIAATLTVTGDIVQAPTFTGTAAALTEVASDVDLGTFDFVVIGRVTN